MPLTESDWSKTSREDGDLSLIREYLRDQKPLAFSIDELQREEGLPILYRSQFKETIESEAESIAEQLTRIYYRQALEVLAYHGEVEMRRHEGVTYYRAT